MKTITKGTTYIYPKKYRPIGLSNCFQSSSSFIGRLFRLLKNCWPSFNKKNQSVVYLGCSKYNHRLSSDIKSISNENYFIKHSKITKHGESPWSSFTVIKINQDVIIDVKCKFGNIWCKTATRNNLLIFIQKSFIQADHNYQKFEYKVFQKFEFDVE